MCARTSVPTTRLGVGRARPQPLQGARGPGGEVRALNLVGNIVSGQGYTEEGLRILEQAKELAARLGDRSSLAVVVSCLGLTCVELGRIEEGRAQLQEALTVFREEGARRSEAVSTQHLGNTFFYEGRYEEACECASRGLAIARAIGYRRGEAIAAGNLAINALQLGRLREAEEYYAHFREISREVGDRPGEGHAANGLGRIALVEGRCADAEGHFETSLELARELDHRRDESTALGNLALTAHQTGKLAAARERYTASLAIACETGDEFSEACFRALFGRTLLCLGGAAEAEGFGEEALRISGLGDIGARNVWRWAPWPVLPHSEATCLARSSWEPRSSNWGGASGRQGFRTAASHSWLASRFSKAGRREPSRIWMEFWAARPRGIGPQPS